MLAGNPSGAHGYQSYPLTGSPARRLLDETARLLSSGTVPRCPHPGEPAFWLLPAGVLACGPCAAELLEAGAGTEQACHACGAPASAVAAWVVGDVPCVAALCQACHSTGLVPILPN